MRTRNRKLLLTIVLKKANNDQVDRSFESFFISLNRLVKTSLIKQN